MKDDDKKKTLYEVLGVSRDARAGDIRDAYARFVAEMRKESTAPNPTLSAMAKVALDTLTDPEKRAQYDKTLGVLKRAAAPAPARRKKRSQGPAAGLAIAAVFLLAAAGAAYWYFMMAPAAKPAASTAGAGLSPQLVADQVAPGIGRVQGALMSGEVRDLGIAVAAAENEMVTTCRGFVAGAQLTVKIGGNPAQKVELARVREDLDICTLSVKGVAAGLKLRESAVAPSEKLLAIAPHPTGGQSVWRAVGAAIPLQDPKGPALEVKSSGPLENGTPVFDSHARLVGIVVAPHAYGEGVVAALGAARIPQSRGTIATAIAAEKASAAAAAAPAPASSSASTTSPAPSSAPAPARAGGRGTLVAEGFSTLWREDEDGQIEELLDDVTKGKVGIPLAYWTKWTGRDASRRQPVHCRVVQNETDVAIAEYDQRPFEIETDGYWYCALTRFSTSLEDLKPGAYTFTIFVEGRPVAESTVRIERALVTPTRLMGIVVFVGAFLLWLIRRKRAVVTEYGH